MRQAYQFERRCITLSFVALGLGNNDRLRIYCDLLQTLSDFRSGSLLISSTKVLGEEFLRRSEHRHIVDRTCKPMALVRGKNVLDRITSISKSDDHLVSFPLVH